MTLETTIVFFVSLNLYWAMKIQNAYVKHGKDFNLPLFLFLNRYSIFISVLSGIVAFYELPLILPQIKDSTVIAAIAGYSNSSITKYVTDLFKPKS